ncbi:hypothetical protein H257_02945 [Aphanomyces astaci]|uniref:Uncharacterized protein n=1 Tax=Aphanomyces astaci TaxID=112090 RepID=W4H0K2_APHAT|nr:hypothetical protein H257_02945 [Aphanomyces astaci]ETV85076.1 hypothetical protein H257_02945 [Aphanomyces astaci]|eukprot:XP_009825094.1 hypothetical protein H257_02945 [Aphanomyces astaci]
MSGFKLHAHDVLRDPTKDELYNGPKREKLPAAVQRMDAADTACTFCGVSYFVFAEVQELTQRVRRYERQCQTFATWMQREKATNATMRNELALWTRDFHTAMGVASEKLVELHRRNTLQATSIQSLEAKLTAKETELEGLRCRVLAETATKVLELEARIVDKDQTIAQQAQHMEGTLREARVVYEAAQAAWTLERTSLLTQHSVQSAAGELERQRLEELVVKMEQNLHASAVESQEFAAKAAESDARWRDVTHMMECQATSVTEAQVKLHQMQAQVELAQAEAARVAANAQVERADVGALQDDVAKYKHLATALEKNKALLLAERDELKQTIAIAHDKVNQVKAQLTGLQRRLDEQGRQMEAVQATHNSAMANLKAECAKEVAALKAWNVQSANSTTTAFEQQVAQLEDEVRRLKEDDTVVQLKQMLVVAEKRTIEADKALQEAKGTCQSYMEELQRAKLSSHQDKSAATALEKKLRDVEAALRDTKAAMEQERADWDRKHVAWERKVAERDVKLDAMAKDLQQMRSAAPTVVVKEVVTSNNNNKALEGEVERLTHIVAQKDQEIQLLQQTVHRECMERTSMLEKMRSAKILPDMVTTHGSSPHLVDERGENDHGGNNGGGGGGLASFYEKLRKKKARPKTKA